MKTGDKVSYVKGCGHLDDYSAYVTGEGPEPDECEVTWYAGGEDIVSDIFNMSDIVLDTSKSA